MLAVFRRNPLALVLAILLHVGLAVFLILEINWRDPVKPIGGDVQVVQAELVDGQQLEQAAEKRRAEELAAVKAAEDARRQALEERRAEEKRKLAEIEARKQREQEKARQAVEAKKKAEAEKARQAEIQRKQEAEKRRIALEAERKAAEKRKAEEERKAEEKRKREEAERRAAAEAKAEQERKERIAREKAEAERKRKAAAEAKARADRAAREAELAAQFAAEQDASELERVAGLIREKVERNWLRPPGTDGLQCKVTVRVGANGSVLRVNVVESSGSNAFDRSVETAVYKADPLPMPRSERLLAQFRNGLTFIFDPSN